MSQNRYDVETHGHCESYPESKPPLAVVFAECEEDVRSVLQWAGEYRIGVIPFGAGTSLEGQLLPQGPAVSLDLSRMNRLLHVRLEDFLAVAEAGLTQVRLNHLVRNHGLFFPIDPGAEATLGGMAATNASGTMTVRYGGMRQNVLALRVVLANGQVLEVGRPVRKSSSGYDLKDLFIGSEGTLGVITRLTLRLQPLPAHVYTFRVFFPDLVATVRAATVVMASGLPVARLELVDELGMRAVNRYLGRSYPEAPVLFVEFHASTSAGANAEMEEALVLFHDEGAIRTDVARTEQERATQWEARHKLYWALTSHFAGHQFMITDVAVPLSSLPEIVAQAQHLLGEMSLEGSIVGHVGDGNFHTLVAVPPGEYSRAERFAEQVVEIALNLGGTASAEHGVGLRKKRFLPLEHGPAVEWMRQLKALFDPAGVLNPGKVV
ncbi:MAG: FAD-linked oxidase C-terminal domain-containing protein [Armatimonadota bacterium]|nr:FAD-linked oxidase C-terminal domain-containing protein [Armatimonadota bacterium]